MPKMADNTLKGICEAKLNNALGWVGGLLSKERILALQYYRGNLFGNEQDGRSKVVSRDVAEAIDGMMPSLIKVFAAVDTVVSCSPRRKDSEQSAKQATDYLNWVFQTQPNSFDLLQTWLKDGLLSKLGVVKSWWDESEKVTFEEYEGLTRNQYLTLLSDPEIEPMEVEIRPPQPPLIDPGATPPAAPSPAVAPSGPAGVASPLAGPALATTPSGGVTGHALASLPSQPPPQAAVGTLPQTPANMPAMGQVPPTPPVAPQAAPSPSPNVPGYGSSLPPDDGSLYDCRLRRTHKDGKIMIAAIPPEEFLTDRRAVSLPDATFCAHRAIRRATDLIEMGYDPKIVNRLSGGTELDFNTEVLNRFQSEDESPQREDTDELDPAMRHIWVAECYLKVDYDGDGVAEWRHVTLAGGGGFEILENETCEGHPFSAWTPIKDPHKLWGESLADKTMDIQLIKSTVWRQVLDGMYFNNSPQLTIIEGQVNMEDVLTRRPGGVIRARSQNAVMPLPVQDSSQSGMSMLGYLDSVREARTGVRRWSPGLEGSELNPLAGTATGVNSVDDASEDTIELFARNFAEQGLKPLFKRLLELTCKFQDKAKTIRLRGQWVDIDPSTWDSEMDMQVMVGLGTGNKDRQSAQLTAMLTQIDQPIAQLQGGLSGPLLTPQNVYAKLMKLVESYGYKSSDNFYMNPEEAPPQASKPPDPKIQIEQMRQQGQMQRIQAQTQADQQTEQARVKSDGMLELLKAHLQEENDKRDAAVSAMRMQHESALNTHAARINSMSKAFDAYIKHQAHQQKMAQGAAQHSRQMEKMRMSAPTGQNGGNQL